MIIHIGGSSSAGKTTLGLKLKEKFNNIVLKDFDDLRSEFKTQCISNNISFELFKKNFKKLYQSFLDDFVNLNKGKIILLTGIECYINGESMSYNKQIFHPKFKLNTRADYKFAIKIDNEDLLKQRWERDYEQMTKYLIWALQNEKERLYKIYVKKDKLDIKDIEPNFDWIFGHKLHIAHLENWNDHYRESGYKFATRDKLFDLISKIIAKT
jgi:uridine kinase